MLNLLEPYLMVNENVSNAKGNDRYRGYSKDLLDEIAEIGNFNYEFNVIKNEPSKFDPEKQKWVGVIGEILDGRALLGISDLTMTHQRRAVIDFSLPYMTLEISNLRVNKGLFVRCGMVDRTILLRNKTLTGATYSNFDQDIPASALTLYPYPEEPGDA
ncbi:hypothetical protein NQ317_002690 [Molorchus minor]|uniref:Ionotropic glutamate receptor L-glutamate and glycine-binding domain-containing protein n=1 Tax=Molorchus minor TaxID=1323400 RepID=A0ABQ9JWD7_9CUCU|nr:hypothetical protein NQ317_002690 [Molorchus minor]